MMQLDLNTPLTAGEILLRCEQQGDSAADTASRLVALAAALVQDLDCESRSNVAFSMLSCAQFLNGTASDEVAH
jgi:hypothetical protein